MSAPNLVGFSELQTYSRRLPREVTPALYHRPTIPNPVDRSGRVFRVGPRLDIRQSRSQVNEPLGNVTGYDPLQAGKVTHFPLDTLQPDSHQILNVLTNLSNQYGRNPEVRAFAEGIVGKIPNAHIALIVRTLTRWVRGRVRYVPDPDGAEFVKSPLNMIAEVKAKGYAAGDCDDHVLLLNSFLISMGIPAKPVAAMVHNRKYYDHVLTSVRIENGWRTIDPCAKSGVEPTYSKLLVP